MRGLGFLALLILAGCGNAAADYKASHATTHTLEFPTGNKRSATAIGPHALLTAMHCFSGSTEMRVSDELAQIKSITNDDRGHVIVVVDIEFKTWASMGLAPSQGDSVYIFGNPGSAKDIFRYGYVGGVFRGALLVDFNGWFGDSGAGVFNSRGELVGVVSALYIDKFFKMPAVFPFRFTDKQWAMALS